MSYEKFKDCLESGRQVDSKTVLEFLVGLLEPEFR